MPVDDMTKSWLFVKDNKNGFCSAGKQTKSSVNAQLIVPSSTQRDKQILLHLPPFPHTHTQFSKPHYPKNPRDGKSTPKLFELLTVYAMDVATYGLLLGFHLS